jgi:hypothetical protein
MARPCRALIHFHPLVGDRGEQRTLLPTSLRETDLCSYLKESEEIKAIYDNLAVSPATEPENPPWDRARVLRPKAKDSGGLGDPQVLQADSFL